LDEGINVIEGRASFVGPRTVVVNGEEFEGRHVILATGSRASVPPVAGLEDVQFLTNESIFALPELPKTLGVLGAGPVGVEMAQAFARLGSKVTLIERMDRVLPLLAPEVHDILVPALTADGVDVRTGVSVQEVRESELGLVVRLPGEDIDVEQLLVAAGRVPNTADLHLDLAGVTTDETGLIVVDRAQRTRAAGVFAVGDCCLYGGLTHIALYQAYVAVTNATVPFRRRVPVKYPAEFVPSAVFTDPEVATIGLSQSADESHRSSIVFNSEIDRAIIAGRVEGFAKIVAQPRRGTGMRYGGRIVGATVVGPRAADTLQEAVVAMQSGAFTGRIAQAMHPYPSWGQALQMAALRIVQNEGVLEDVGQ
ncbi:MAG: NAD(P)/FAD-dependent oxidoreductase, partial [Acidimicrobiales bacterium]